MAPGTSLATDAGRSLVSSPRSLLAALGSVGGASADPDGRRLVPSGVGIGVATSISGGNLLAPAETAVLSVMFDNCVLCCDEAIEPSDCCKRGVY